MDLHGDDEWIFDDLERNNNSENQPPLSLESSKKSAKVFNEEDFVKLKQSIHNYEIRQKADEEDKRVFVENFYHLLITARSQIKQLEEKNRELSDKLESYMSVKCPQCDRSFRAHNSRVLPNYVRYVKACHRLELDFGDAEELRRWLRLSNLDTDADGLPVIHKAEKVSKTLKDVGSLLVEAKQKDHLNKTEYVLEVGNLSDRVSVSELKGMFDKVAKVVDAYLDVKGSNKAIVYFNYHNHLNRVLDKFQGKSINGLRLKLIDRSVNGRRSPQRLSKGSRR